MAAGTGLVAVGMSWMPPAAATSPNGAGARLYDAECAACHGVLRTGRAPAAPSGARVQHSAPSLGADGHAWQHPDARLAEIIGRGTGAPTRADGAPAMPAFAERLDPGQVAAVLEFLKSRWPAGIRTYQAALAPDGQADISVQLLDPAWLFPAWCPPTSAAAAPGEKAGAAPPSAAIPARALAGAS
jgi:mono/diheme cytochrome c family protein